MGTETEGISFVIEIRPLCYGPYFLSNELEVFSFADGLVEYNGESIERKPKDNVNNKLRITFFFQWNIIFILLKTDILKDLLSLFLQGLKDSTKETCKHVLFPSFLGSKFAIDVNKTILKHWARNENSHFVYLYI